MRRVPGGAINNDIEELNEELQKALKREEDLHKQLKEEKEEREIR